MTAETRTIDPKGRVILPKAFANATVIIEQISDTEIRIRKAKVIPEDELRFAEETVSPLSNRDRDLFLALLNNPPPPNAALRRAVAKYRRRHG
jgi:DNA-binding transcriptional regulator/RsmH inhibitor MraZ